MSGALRRCIGAFARPAHNGGRAVLPCASRASVCIDRLAGRRIPSCLSNASRKHPRRTGRDDDVMDNVPVKLRALRTVDMLFTAIGAMAGNDCRATRSAHDGLHRILSAVDEETWETHGAMQSVRGVCQQRVLAKRNPPYGNSHRRNTLRYCALRAVLQRSMGTR
jgi:hypothetical protein